MHLSSTEFNLLAALARRADQFVTTEVLLKETWGAAYQRKGGYVRVYMHALRYKLEKDPTNPKYLLNDGTRGYSLRTSASTSRGGSSPPTTRVPARPHRLSPSGARQVRMRLATALNTWPACWAPGPCTLR